MNRTIEDYSNGVELLIVKSELYALECEIWAYKIRLIGKFNLWGSPFFYRMSKIQREIKRLSK